MSVDIETHYEIHDNARGDMLKVGPDPDGVGLVVIQYYNETLVIPKRMAKGLRGALQEMDLEEDQ